MAPLSGKGGREWGIRMLLIFSPFLLLGLVELLLRAGGWYAPEPLFRKATQNNAPVWQINTRVAARYLDPRRPDLPTPYPETFALRKSPETFRIFCMGGSTTAGFPFDGQVPFPQQMKQFLKDRYPERRFEVINLGISSLNSFAVLDFVPEVVEKEPDLIVLYAGHNEFYGPLGSASALAGGSSGSLVRFSLSLQKFHLYQLIRGILLGLRENPAGGDPQQTLMEQAGGNRDIVYGGEVYRTTLGDFAENLSSVLESFAAHNIPVMMGQTVSNLSQFPPFGSDYALAASPELEQVKSFLTEGGKLFQAGQWAESEAVYRKALQLEPEMPDLWFRLGQLAWQQGDSASAKRWYQGARDRDRVRFRASGAINAIIDSLGGVFGNPVIDLPALFAGRSPGGIPGKTLFCDHLHPNPLGYYLMGRAFGESIVAAGLPGVSRETVSRGPYFIGDLDWDIGLLRVFKLLRRWPFPERTVDYGQYRPHGDPTVARRAYDYLFGHHDWVKVQLEQADAYREAGDWRSAARQLQAITLVLPYLSDPWIQLANLYKDQQQWDAAVAAYREALQLDGRSGLLHYHLGLSYAGRGDKEKALAEMQFAAAHPSLTPLQKANARFYQAGYLVDLGRSDEAVALLKQLLSENPDFRPARIFLESLQ
ncbi:MAG: tetratricopeptide repeat protein [Calditrichaeota bacterium]|nr:tetratricopeptide repeat protein [Calditrichota bacterium]